MHAMQAFLDLDQLIAMLRKQLPETHTTNTASNQ
jgi:hypothetical protein